MADLTTQLSLAVTAIFSHFLAVWRFCRSSSVHPGGRGSLPSGNIGANTPGKTGGVAIGGRKVQALGTNICSASSAKYLRGLVLPSAACLRLSQALSDVFKRIAWCPQISPLRKLARRRTALSGWLRTAVKPPYSMAAVGTRDSHDDSE